MGSGSPCAGRYYPAENVDVVPAVKPEETGLLEESKADAGSLIRFIDFKQLKNHGKFPKYPDNYKITTDIKSIDRDKSLIIFVSHAWLKNERFCESHRCGSVFRTLPDDSNYSIYDLCVKGIEKIVATQTTREIKTTYLWFDYSCINQSAQNSEEILQLYTIMEFCDLIFTPIHDADCDKWELPLGRVVNYYDDYAAQLWNSGSYAYLNRAWCRLELFYGTNVPLYYGSHSGHSDKHPSSHKMNKPAKTVASHALPPKSSPKSNTVVVTPNKSLAATTAAASKPQQAPGKATAKTAKKPKARHFKFKNSLAYFMSNAMRPHAIFGTKELTADRDPIFLPPLQNAMYEKFSPMKGFVSYDSDMEFIKELSNYLTPLVAASMREYVPYDGDTADSALVEPHGKGVMRYANGDVYRGDFHHGQRFGKGTMTFMTGDVYEGDWEGDCMHGTGTLRLVNGHVYQGDWRRNLRDGEGNYFVYQNPWDYSGTIAARPSSDGGNNSVTVRTSHTGGSSSDRAHQSRSSRNTEDASTGSPPDVAAPRIGSDRNLGSRHSSVILTIATDLSDRFTNAAQSSKLKPPRGADSDVHSTIAIHDTADSSACPSKTNDSSVMEHPPVGDETSAADSKVNNEQEEETNSDYKLGPALERYEGQWKDDVKHGQGKYWFANGDCYEGQYEHDMKHGRGRYVASNGDIYTGEFHTNSIHGEGVLEYANGELYEGDFENDLRHGRGEHTFISGDVYNGEFQHNMVQGHGTMKFRNGDVYEGDFKNEMRHGVGKFKYRSGDRYEGHFNHNEFFGTGTMYYRDGSSCAFINGRKKPPVAPTMFVLGAVIAGAVVTDAMVS